MKQQFLNYIHQLQDQICLSLEKIDGYPKFIEDLWERPEGGGGRTRVMENGQVFEKGGVNISYVHGVLPESMQKMFGVAEADFFCLWFVISYSPKKPDGANRARQLALF